jgi:hypothetical protein
MEHSDFIYMAEACPRRILMQSTFNLKQLLREELICTVHHIKKKETP